MRKVIGLCVVLEQACVVAAEKLHYNSADRYIR